MPLLSNLTDDDRVALLRLGSRCTFEPGAVLIAEGSTNTETLSQPELASLIGASEPSLHRALTELRAREVIGTRYRRLVVRDVEALRVL